MAQNVNWSKDTDTNIIEKTCSFGERLNEECHKNVKVELKSFNDFDEDIKSELKWRACLKDMGIESICRYHEVKFRKSFKKFSKCYDAFNIHRKRKKPHGTHNVTLKMALTLEQKNREFISVMLQLLSNSGSGSKQTSGHLVIHTVDRLGIDR